MEELKDQAESYKDELRELKDSMDDYTTEEEEAGGLDRAPSARRPTRHAGCWSSDMENECVVANPNCNGDVRLSRWVSAALKPVDAGPDWKPYEAVNLRCESTAVSGYEVIEEGGE